METNKIYNENCIDTMNRMDFNSIDLIVTSPPYFNAREYSQYENLQYYLNEMNDIFQKAFDVLKEGKICVINISPIIVARKKRSESSKRIPLPFYYVPMMEKIGFEFLEDIIWKKPEGSAFNRNGGFFVHRKPIAYKPNIVTEYVLVFRKKTKLLIDSFLKNESLVKDGYERTNVWEINPETKSWHSAPFPVELCSKIISYYSYENDLIYDPFMGSATTAIACLDNKRKFIGSELDNNYFHKSLERLRVHQSQLTMF